jgi:hypothetical protein
MRVCTWYPQGDFTQAKARATGFLVGDCGNSGLLKGGNDGNGNGNLGGICRPSDGVFGQIYVSI